MALRKPTWLKASLGAGGAFGKVSGSLRQHGLHTVCEEAHCPNKGECWGLGTATFLIMGDVCTRNCRFCAVQSGASGKPLNAKEPLKLVKAAKTLNLKYVVLTSVDRDDLPDGGSMHFAHCIRALKSEGFKVEVLIPDFLNERLTSVLDSGPDALAHNIEVVRRLQSLRDARASYDRSLQTLRQAKEAGATTKSSIMLGLGETKGEVLEAMDDLRKVGCDMLAIGQYLQPTRGQAPVVEYIHPDTFLEYAKEAKAKGFKRVVSSPLARTSYHAAETA
jgi:lipoic acid synthetase